MNILVTLVLIISSSAYEIEGAKYSVKEASNLVLKTNVCHNIPGVDVIGNPQDNETPLKSTIYRVLGVSGRNDAHVLALDISATRGFSFNFLVVQALNQDGIPSGHYIHYPCADAKTGRGRHVIDSYCSKQGEKDDLSKSFGTTRFMYSVPFESQQLRTSDGVFWLWSRNDKNVLKDGDRPPKRIQFLFTAARNLANGKSDYYNARSRVVDFKHHFEPLEDLDEFTEDFCYAKPVGSAVENGVFLSKNQTDIPLNDLFWSHVVEKRPPVIPLILPVKMITTQSIGTAAATTNSTLKPSSAITTFKTTTSTTTTSKSTTASPVSTTTTSALTATPTTPRSTTASSKTISTSTSTTPLSTATIQTSTTTKSTTTTTTSTTTSSKRTSTTAGFFSTSTTKLLEFNEEGTSEGSVPDFCKHPDNPTCENHCYENWEENCIICAQILCAAAVNEEVCSQTLMEGCLQTRTGLCATLCPDETEDNEEIEITIELEISYTELAVSNVYDGCRMSKGCIEDHPGCASTQSCDVLATYTKWHDKGPDYYKFELLGTYENGQGYVAMGLSTDMYMGDDSVVECMADQEGRTGVFESWNQKNHKNTRLAGTSCGVSGFGSVTDCNVSVVNGKLLCSFFKPARTKVMNQMFDLDEQSYHILTAHGSEMEISSSVSLSYERTEVFLENQQNNLPQRNRRHINKLRQNRTIFQVFSPTRGTSSKLPAKRKDVFDITRRKREARHREGHNSGEDEKVDSSETTTLSATTKHRGPSTTKKTTRKVTTPRLTKPTTRTPQPPPPTVKPPWPTTPKVLPPVTMYGSEETTSAANPTEANSNLFVFDPERKIGKHRRSYSTDIPIDLSRNMEQVDSGVIYRKLHGILMLVAWIVYIPNAHFIVRYFRETWMDVTYVNRPYWFVAHVTLVTLGVLFCVYAFGFTIVYRIAHNKSFPSYPQAVMHMALGYITLAGLAIQVITGILRDRQSEKQTALNVIHFLSGTISYFVALFIFMTSNQLRNSYLFCDVPILIWMWCFWSAFWHVTISVQMFRINMLEGKKSWVIFHPWLLPKTYYGGEMPGQWFRIVVFAFHAAGSCIAATLFALPYLVSVFTCICEFFMCFYNY